MDKKFNEYRLTFDRNGKEVDRKLTDRGHVMISELDAKELNVDKQITKLYYEIAEKPKATKPASKK